MCEQVVQNAISCCPDSSHDGADDGADAPHPAEAVLRILTQEGDHSLGHDLCATPLTETGYEVGCDPNQHPGAQLAHEILFWVTIGILGTFLVELLASAILLGGAFFRRFFYVLDALVVAASLSLELVFRFLSIAPSALPGMLVLFRAWRFVRIGHGLTASAREAQEREVRLAAQHLEKLEKRMKLRGLDVPERPATLRKSTG